VHGPADARRLAATIAAGVRGQTCVRAALLEVSASVGVAWTDDPEAHADQLVAAADAAMYQAKQRGGGEPVLA
jgi:GGDEF domain-containing protein